MAFSMETLEVGLAKLLRVFAIQGTPRLMFLLGAGASVRAGIPTATEMTWIFKREIYCSETGISKEALRDLTVERNRRRLQEYFDQREGFPSHGADNEYSFYFEFCYPDSGDRRSFIRQLLQKATPTIGHECLAVLLAQGCCDWIWTTNFDDLIERAERPNTPRRLHHVGPESVSRIDTIFAEHHVPVIVKLHGDYRYDSLQNTEEELRSLDEQLREALVQLCREDGLIIVGYSGRDDSVMSALEMADADGEMRHGLFWCIREGGQPTERVKTLVQRVVHRTGRGGFIEITSFDDLMFRLYRQYDLKDAHIEEKTEALFEQRRPFVVVTKREPRNPLKTNASKIMEYPTTLYRFPTSIETWRELREIISQHPIVAGLLSGHVLASGNRELIRTTFGVKMVGSIELVDIRPADLRYADSVVMGLLYDMIGQSLTDQYGLYGVGHRSRSFYIPDPAIYKKERAFEFTHKGKQTSVPRATEYTMSGQDFVINEAFTYQLDFHEDTLWFILEPRVVVTSDGQNLATVEQRRVIANDVMSERYNRQAHERLLFWFYYLSSITQPITFNFPPRDAPGVRFILDSHFAFSSQR
jgi:NAD-dependent SIR2 family protein deacetylase